MYRDNPRYYNLRMCWIIGTNPLACMADQPQRWYEAMRDLDFVVTQDIFMTPTIMALADVVLPLSTFAEHDGLVTPNYGRNQHFVGAMNKAVENPGTKSDLEILIDMGKRLHPELWEGVDSVDEFFDSKLRENYGYGLEELRERGTIQTEYEYRKYEKGLLRDDGGPGFQTGTGRIELWSPILQGFGEQPLPYYEEPEYSHISKPELAEEFPLYYTTGGRHISMFHSEHRQIASMRALHPDPLVTINPATAREHGIADGDWVHVASPLGSCCQRARLTIEVPEKLVHLEHAWWFPELPGEEPELFGVWRSNANNLIPHESVSVTGYGAPYNNGICSIRRAEDIDLRGIRDRALPGRAGPQRHLMPVAVVEAVEAHLAVVIRLVPAVVLDNLRVILGHHVAVVGEIAGREHHSLAADVLHVGAVLAPLRDDGRHAALPVLHELLRNGLEIDLPAKLAKAPRKAVHHERHTSRRSPRRCRSNCATSAAGCRRRLYPAPRGPFSQRKARPAGNPPRGSPGMAPLAPL